MKCRLKIHCIQHVPFEGPGLIEEILSGRGHSFSITRMYDNEQLPDAEYADWVIIMGGPMGIYDHEDYPWLKGEKDYISEVVKRGKTVLGICLGAQLIADRAGAEVSKNRYREIGWFPVKPDPAVSGTVMEGLIPEGTELFHWHGDTFAVPAGAVPLGSTIACENQGFIMDDRIVALQFHLETTPDSALALIENCGDELDGTTYVQNRDEVMADPDRFLRINRIMKELLAAMEEKTFALKEA